MTQDPALDALTVGEARRQLFNNMDGRPCPCCYRPIALYRRWITTSMAISLAEMYRYFQEHPQVEWLHVANHLAQLKSHGARGGDYAKLRFWGLVERKPNDRRKDGSSRVGLWKLTDLGREFVRGNTRIPKFAYLYRNTQFPPPDGDPTVSFRECLKENFDYARLLGIEPPPDPPKIVGVEAPPPPKPSKPRTQIGWHGGRR